MSEIYYRPMPAKCRDGVVRRVQVKCYRFNGGMAADTFFTVPAHVRIRGRYIAGYVCKADDLAYCQDSEPGVGLEFRHLDRHAHIFALVTQDNAS